MKRKIEIVVLSDLQLGTRHTQVKTLLQYLKSIKPTILILTGNILNIKNLNKLTNIQWRVLHRLLKMLANGTRIYYLTGETDAALRRFTDFDCGNFFLRDQLLLQLQNKKYWFLHGDVYAYRTSWWQRIKNFFYPNEKKGFEKKLIDQTLALNYDVVVCGFSRQPKIETINNITYMNCGDWIKNQTALEYNGSEWTLFKYDALDFELIHPKLMVLQEHLEDDAYSLNYGTKTNSLLKPIQDFVLVETALSTQGIWDGIEY